MYYPKKTLTEEQKRVYNIMIAKAHNTYHKKYTTADLMAGIHHTLTTNERRRLGRRFFYYAEKNPQHFIIFKSSSNYKYKLI